MKMKTRINLKPLDKLKGIYSERIKRYIRNMVEGKRPHCKEDFLKVERFIEMLDKYEVRTGEADKLLLIGEEVCKFVDGSDKEGYNLSDKPFKWLDWQVFDVYATFIFYKPGTNLRLVRKNFTEIARKQGKSTYIAILALCIALKEMREGGAPIGIVSDTGKNAENLFRIIEMNILSWYNNSKLQAQRDGWRILNNNQTTRIQHNNFAPDSEGKNGGKIDIQVYTAKPEGVHSLRKKVVIVDELHLMKHGAAVHTQMEKSIANFPDGLTLTITTAAISKNNYCYDYTEYCKKVLNKQIKKDDLYIHIAKADEDDEGNVDIMDESQWYKANPSLGEALSIDTLRSDAEGALNISDDVKLQFLAYSLNIFQDKVTSEFQPSKFITSDMEYSWTLEELAKLEGVTWYGGFDLSIYNDLQAACLYGEYGDIGIVIPHAWCPSAEVTQKTTIQNMDVYRWKDDGFFTICNGETNDNFAVIDWFKEMRERGFNIGEIGFDTRFVTMEMKGELARANFEVINEKQYISHLSVGFRYMEGKAYNKKLYYLHSELYEYCLNNLLVTTKRGQEVFYTKKDNNSKIDAFDASVFAAIRHIQNVEKEKEIRIRNDYLNKIIEEGGY